MQIKIIWSPFYIISNTSNNFFYVSIESYSIYDSIWKSKAALEKGLDLRGKFPYSKFHFQDQYQFTDRMSIYDGLLDSLKKLVDTLEEIDFLENNEYVIKIGVLGNEYLQRIMSEISIDGIIEIKPMSSSVTYLSDKLKQVTINMKHSYVFDFSNLLVGSMLVTGSRIFIFKFKAYIQNIKTENDKLLESIKQLRTCKKDVKNNKPSYFLRFQCLYNWLLKTQSNIINFLSQSSILIESLAKYEKSDEQSKTKIMVISKLWNSLLYELIKIKQPRGSIYSITNILIKIINLKMMKNPCMSLLTLNDGKFKNDFMNEWLENLEKIRMNNFHLNETKHENMDYLMIMFDGREINDDIKNKTINFIELVRDMILNTYIYIWQVFNFNTGSILNTSENMYNYLKTLK